MTPSCPRWGHRNGVSSSINTTRCVSDTCAFPLASCVSSASWCNYMSVTDGLSGVSSSWSEYWQVDWDRAEVENRGGVGALRK